MSEKSIDITFVRHGEAQHNKEGYVAGQTNSELTNMGKQQARELAINLAHEHQQQPYDFIICSDLQRTTETAAIIAEELNKTRNVPIYQDERLRERHAGDWQGKSSQELQTSGVMGKTGTKEWYEQKLGVSGESLADVRDRTSQTLADIIEAYQGKRVLIVTHAVALGQMAQYLKGETPYAEESTQPFKEAPWVETAEGLTITISITPEGQIQEVTSNQIETINDPTSKNAKTF